MRDLDVVLVDGDWVSSGSAERILVTDPATDAVIGHAPAGCAIDVEGAVKAARDSLARWSALPISERVGLLRLLRARLAERGDEIASLITAQMGTPIGFSRAAQIGLPLRNFDVTLDAAEMLADGEVTGRSRVVRDPVGVVAAITPWNFPLHQIVAKVVPALLAGCTVVLKPSELTPFDAAVFGEASVEVGLPAGVLNIVFGAAATGAALVAHPDIDMVSFTGSTRAGRQIAEIAGRGLKKVALELGGKSANIVLDDADLERAIPAALGQCFVNSGQTCAALTRLIVPVGQVGKVESLALDAIADWKLGDPADADTKLGPLASRAQQARVQSMIRDALAAGARLVTGGADQPNGFAIGAYVAPTILSDVTSDMAIAREEVFGPVLVIQTHDGDADAVRIANDSDYGLSGGVWSADEARAVSVARDLQTGQVILNGAMLDLEAPFGGVKQSGIGREYGRYGLEEFFNLKAITHVAEQSRETT